MVNAPPKTAIARQGNVISEAEYELLSRLKRDPGILLSQFEAQSHRNPVGTLIPGLGVLKRLVKRGLVFVTDEEPDESGFEWTPEVYIEPDRESDVDQLLKEYLGGR